MVAGSQNLNGPLNRQRREGAPPNQRGGVCVANDEQDGETPCFLAGLCIVAMPEAASGGQWCLRENTVIAE